MRKEATLTHQDNLTSVQLPLYRWSWLIIYLLIVLKTIDTKVKQMLLHIYCDNCVNRRWLRGEKLPEVL